MDRPEFFTDVMYRRSAVLTADICARHGIPRDREHIVGHHEVPGSDHTDPGVLWDWDRYLLLMAAATDRREPPGGPGAPVRGPRSPGGRLPCRVGFWRFATNRGARRKGGGTEMASEFTVGDHVRWNSEA